MDNKERIELSDEELDKVVGGIDVGDRVKVDTRTTQYCPGCGKLSMIIYGTVVGKQYYEAGGHYFINIQSDCCGYVQKCADFSCKVQ